MVKLTTSFHHLHALYYVKIQGACPHSQLETTRFPVTLPSISLSTTKFSCVHNISLVRGSQVKKLRSLPENLRFSKCTGPMNKLKCCIYSQIQQ